MSEAGGGDQAVDNNCQNRQEEDAEANEMNSDMLPAGRTRKVDTLEKLLRVFSEEQLEQLADVFSRMQERAMERRCLQETRVVFDEKGHPTHLKGSDDVRFAKVTQEAHRD